MKACRLTFFCFATPLAVAACAYNEQIDLVGTDPLPALTDTPAATELDGRPSLTDGLDRQGWPTVMVRVPRNQVAHGPTYAKNFRWSHDRGPWDPAYPTATDAIEDVTNPGADVADALADPFYAAAMLAWAPIDMIFITQPWQRQRSPSEDYALVPARAPAHLVDWFGGTDQPEVEWSAPPDDDAPGMPTDMPDDRAEP